MTPDYEVVGQKIVALAQEISQYQCDRVFILLKKMAPFAQSISVALSAFNLPYPIGVNIGTEKARIVRGAGKKTTADLEKAFGAEWSNLQNLVGDGRDQVAWVIDDVSDTGQTLTMADLLIKSAGGYDVVVPKTIFSSKHERNTTGFVLKDGCLGVCDYRDARSFICREFQTREYRELESGLTQGVIKALSSSRAY